MQNNTKKITVCSLTASVGIVLMVVGSFLGIAIYAVPMLVGIILVPLGRRYGIKYQISTFAVIAILSFLLIADVEQSMIFTAFLGWYPALRQKLQKIPMRILRVVIKLVVFNVPVIISEWIVFTALVPQALSRWIAITLIILGNIVFAMYDILLPRIESIVIRYANRIM